MKRRSSWDVKPEPLFRVPIDAAKDGRIDGVPTHGLPFIEVGDLVKYIIPDDWEHHAIEAPIFTEKPALGVIRKVNWVMLTTNQGAFYRPEAEVYWGINGATTKHMHDDLSVVAKKECQKDVKND